MDLHSLIAPRPLPTGPWQQLTPSDHTTLAYSLLLSSLSWTASFLLFRFLLCPRRSHDFSNRMVSQCHVAVALLLASLAIDWSQPLASLGGPNTSLEVLTMVVSLGYFVYDMLCCLAHPSTSDIATTFHHIFTIVGFTFGLYYGKCGTDLVCCLWLMELSNPFMHARELFKEAGVTNPALVTMNDALFVVTFTVARVFCAPWGTYQVVIGDSPTGVKAGAVAIQLVNFLWFYKIVRFAYFKLFKKPRKGKKA